MRSAHPPKLATWVLRRLGSHNEALAGDLLEEYQRGRSKLWYWRQVLIAVSVGQLRAGGSRLRRAGWKVDISPRTIIPATMFLLAFGVVTTSTSPVWDTVVRLEVWAWIVAVMAMSIVVVVKMIRMRRIAPLDGAVSARLRRWVYDEPNEDR